MSDQQLRKIVRWGSLLTILAIAVPMLTGCVETVSPIPPVSSDNAEQSPTALLDAYAKQVDAFVAENPSDQTILAAQARPTVVDNAGTIQTMAIKDVDESAWAAGRYRLVTSCLGSGVLYANFAIGEFSVLGELPPCGSTIVTNSLELVVPENTADMVVTILPVGVTAAVVSYEVQAG